jgi:hypothetical protein
MHVLHVGSSSRLMKMMGWRQKLSIVAPGVPPLDKLVLGELNDGINVVHIATIDGIVLTNTPKVTLVQLGSMFADCAYTHFSSATATNYALPNTCACALTRIRFLVNRLSAERAGFKLH